MSSEAQIRSSLYIRIQDSTTGITRLQYQSNPIAFNADVSTPGGPSPGRISVSPGGTDVDLSKLVNPGLYRIMNTDLTNYVDFGIYEPATGTFYPLLEIMPGETYVGRFSRNLGEEVSGTVTGTGTTATNNTVRLRATQSTSAVDVILEAFEK